MRRIAPIICCLLLCGPILSGCGTLPPANESSVLSSVLSLLEFSHVTTRDNEQREELALVAPQETADPEDVALKQLESQRRHFYRAFEPIYPGVDYAALPE